MNSKHFYKTFCLCISSVLIMAGCNTVHLFNQENKEKVSVYAVSQQGIGEKLGTLTLEDTPQGLKISADLTKIPSGPHGFHIHEYGSCGASGKDGKSGPALAAGGHLNPGHVEHHGTPLTGHLGDLPLLTAQPDGRVQEARLAPRLKLSDVKGHAIVVHSGGDNYSDIPKPLGGGGARIACGVIM